MSRKRAPNTLHSYERAAERLGWGKRYAKRMMSEAQRKGTPIQGKTRHGRRMKLWNGCVFVFASTSTRCITIYPFSEEEE